MNDTSIQFNLIILDLVTNSIKKLEKVNPKFEQFAIAYEIRHPNNRFYKNIEKIAGIIYSWNAGGTLVSVARSVFEGACLELAEIQGEYNKFVFTEYDFDMTSIVNQLEEKSNPIERLKIINTLLTSMYASTINETMLSVEKLKVSAQIKLLVRLREDTKNLIDCGSAIITCDKAPEMETVYRELYNDKLVSVKSTILKIVIEDDVNVKLYDELSHSLDHSQIMICKRKDFGPDGNFDIVITKNINNVKPRQIHFAPCNSKKLIPLLELIIAKDVKRAKFVQAMRPNAWYNDQIGKEFFVTIDDLDRPIALLIKPKNVWEIDSRLLKDKYVDILSITRVKKIEAKQIPKGSIVKWD